MTLNHSRGSKMLNDILIKIAEYERLVKIAYIRKLPNGKYRVLSEKGKNLGTYDSRSAAAKRLRQIEFFKHRDKHKADDKKIDLTKADDYSYSAILRCLKQNADKDKVISFMSIFKKYFDEAIKNKLQKPERVALQKALIKFNKICPIKVDIKLVKKAAISELGDPELVGKYLSGVVQFTLGRISPEKRQRVLDKVKSKIYYLNDLEMASKKMPAAASIGQAIGFIKNILANHDATYIRQVLNSIARHLG